MFLEGELLRQKIHVFVILKYCVTLPLVKVAPTGAPPTRDSVSTSELRGLLNFLTWGQYWEVDREVKNIFSSIPAISWEVKGTPPPYTQPFVFIPPTAQEGKVTYQINTFRKN